MRVELRPREHSARLRRAREMTFELLARESGRARDRVEHLRRHALDVRDQHHLARTLEQRETVRAVMDVEACSEQRGHTGFSIDRPSHA